MNDGEQWDLVAWLEAMQRREARSADIESQAPGEYHLANHGGVWRSLGWLWPHCPRWFLAFGDPVAVSVAREVVDLRRLIKMGLAGNLGEELTPGGFDLLSDADRLWDALQRQYERECLEESRNGGKN